MAPNYRQLLGQNQSPYYGQPKQPLTEQMKFQLWLEEYHPELVRPPQQPGRPPPKQPKPTDALKDAVKDYAKDKGKEYLKDEGKKLISDYLGGNSSLAQTEAANTAWNAGANTATAGTSGLANSATALEAYNSGANAATSGLAQTEGANAAWNAGADAATTSAQAGSNAGVLAGGEWGAGQYAGAAGAALGAYQAAKGMDNGGEGTRAGLTSMGAGIGTMILPGIGTAAGAAIGNVAGYGLQENGWKNDAALLALGPVGWAAFAAKKAGLTNRKTTLQHQQERTKDLINKKVTGFEEYSKQLRPGVNARGDVIEELGEDFVGKTEQGFVNNKFAKSRNEADLTTNETEGSLGNFETFGDDYLGKYSAAQRTAINQALLDNKLYQERKGGIYVTDQAKAKQLAEEIYSKGATPTETKTMNSNGKKLTPIEQWRANNAIPKAPALPTGSRMAPDGINRIGTVNIGGKPQEMTTLIGPGPKGGVTPEQLAQLGSQMGGGQIQNTGLIYGPGQIQGKSPGGWTPTPQAGLRIPVAPPVQQEAKKGQWIYRDGKLVRR